MEFGVFLPVSGRAASAVLADAARSAEKLGFDAVWAADRLIIPWEIRTPYRYSTSGEFIVPPDRPFLEPLTCLAYLAGCTRRIRLGVSVLVLPYRPPLYWAKAVTSIDHLSRGRFILGVGAGWMVEEFEALQVPFSERFKRTHEQLRLLDTLWNDDRCTFEGKYHRFKDIAFFPKPLQRPRVPIWMGGERGPAQRRAGRYGDGWFPYFVRVTPSELAARFENVRRAAREAGRDADRISLNCCLPIEVTREAVRQEEGKLAGTPEQLCEAIDGFRRVGVSHLGLQFMVPRWPERQEQIDRFARHVIPALRTR